MPCFAQRLRPSQRSFKVVDSNRGLFLFQRRLSQHKVGSKVLCEHQSLSTLPRLKPAREQYLQRVLGPSLLVVERGEFHGKIVAGVYQVTNTLKCCQPVLWRFPCALQQLILFIHDASISWRKGSGPFECQARSLLIVTNVVVGKAEVSRGGGKFRIQTRSAFPRHDRLLVTPPVIEKIAQII